MRYSYNYSWDDMEDETLSSQVRGYRHRTTPMEHCIICGCLHPIVGRDSFIRDANHMCDTCLDLVRAQAHWDLSTSRRNYERDAVSAELHRRRNAMERRNPRFDEEDDDRVVFTAGHRVTSIYAFAYAEEDY